MTRVFRAFLWMRWRIFVNSLERTGARDTLERFSVAIDKLGPIMAMILLVPSSIALFVLGLTAGFGVATGSWLVPMELIRFFLLLGLAMIINLFVAAAAGTLVPIGLRAANLDPALASSVVVTTMTDVLGFATFLGLATLFLRYLAIG